MAKRGNNSFGFSSSEMSKQRSKNSQSSLGTSLPDWFSQIFPGFSSGDYNPTTDAVRKGKYMSGSQMQESAMNYFMQQSQNQWNEEMYRKYQSYQGQMEDIRAAGLNPSLMYEGASVGSMASGTGATGAEGTAPQGNPGLSDMMNVIQGVLGITSTASGVVNQVKSQDIQASSVTSENNLRAAQADTESAKKAYYEKQSAMLDKQINSYDERFGWERTNQFLKELQSQANISVTYQQMSESRARIAKIDNDILIDNLRYDMDYRSMLSDLDVKSATVEQIRASIAQKWEEIKNAKFENKVNDLMTLYGAPDASTALMIDAFAQNIDNPNKRAQFVAAMRNALLSKEVSSNNLWSIMDKWLARGEIAAETTESDVPDSEPVNPKRKPKDGESAVLRQVGMLLND